jgi:anti-sigma B factor antagonist
MSTDDHTKPDEVLVPGPEMTVAHAAQLREQLLAAISDGRTTLALDLSGITDFDSAGVQLLLAARRTLVERGGSLTATGMSSTVRSALEVFGLSDTLPVTAAA